MKHFKRYYPIIIITFLIIINTFCGKEASTVNPGDYTEGGGGGDPGYFYPLVTAVYPSNGSTDIPLDTKYIIVFNMPIDTSTVAANISATTTPLPSPPGVPSSKAFTVSTVNNPVVELTFTGSLAGNNLISITILSGILDQGGTIPLSNPGTWTFTTGTALDAVPPTISAGTNNPTGAGVLITAPDIRIDFNEPINPTTINSTTFYLQRIDIGPTTIPTICSWSPAAAPTRAILTPIQPLEASTLLVTPQYRVTVTTGITDLSENNLSIAVPPFTWTFTTASGDPVPGAPSITVGPAIVYVADTAANITWTTDEATNFTLNYGQGDDLSATPITDTVYTTSHSYLLGNPLGTPPSPALDPGSRYFFNISYEDFIGNAAGPTPATPIEFNTETNETPLTIDTSSENQTGLNWIIREADIANTGAFMAWRTFTPGSPGYYSIYGQRYDNSLTPSATWNTGNPVSIFTEASQTYTYSSMVEDGLGGMIVTAFRGNEVRTKRMSSAAGAIVDWGGGTTGASTGLRIDSGGTNSYASAVPVYSGFITNVTSGTTEMGSTGLNNPFFDDSVNLSGLTDGYVIMDPNNHNGTTIDNNTVTQDFIYMLGQNANIIGPGDTYYIGDNVTNTTSFTAQNHTMHSGTNYNNGDLGGTRVYTEHDITLADLTALNLGVGDIIRDGTNYGRITAVLEISVSSINSGTESANRTNHLIDGSKMWTATVTTGDLAERTIGAAYSVITNVTNTDLTLSADIYPTGTENYAIHDTTDSGTANSYTINCLNDSAATWNTVGPTQVFIGDIVIRTNATFDTILAIDTVTSVSDTQLQFSSELFPIGNENYIIYKQGNLDTGTANPNRINHLINGGATWTSVPVAVGDLVVNTTGVPTYAYVNAVTDTDLTLSADIFSGVGNNNYAIYDNFCTTHTDDPSIQSFMQLTVNWAINISNGQAGVTLYNSLVNGTADTPPANPLYDTGGALAGVNLNDIAINFTSLSAPVNPNVGTVNTVGFTHALGTNVAGMFADNENYNIIRFNNLTLNATDIVDTGIATGGSATTLVDSTNTFASVNAGDIAYNLTDDQYAMVTSVAVNTLTLSRNATFGNTDRYIIVHDTGVLYVWYNGTNIQANIHSMADGTLLRAEYTLVAGATNPYTFSDGNGNAYLIYISGGQLMAGLYRAAGTAIWTSGAIDAVTSIHKLISDNNGGVIVLYQNGGTMYARRIRDNSGAYQTTLLGSIITAAPTSYDIVCNSTATDVIIAGEVGGNIYAWRRGGTTWNANISTATGIQQNPKIFTDWTNARIVWEDERFTSTVGYGIFGMQVTAGGGALSAAWRVNTNTADYNGASVVLNSGNKYWPGIQIVTYNNGLDGALIWEDWRNINATLPYEGSDLLYIDIAGFTPY